MLLEGENMGRILLFNQVPIDVISKKDLIGKIILWAEAKKKKMVVYMNAYGVVEYSKNQKYANVVKNADIVYPDGWGPVFASRFFKDKLTKRVNVGDFVDELLADIDSKRLGIYLVGCESATNEKTLEAIKKRYPKIKVCGGDHGFFNQREEQEIVEKIKKTRPRIVLVGMSVPKQEYFIARNFPSLPPAVYMGVGGVFYYISGLKKRAPRLMRKYGFEWLYRLLQEPKRLWRRYTLGNLNFTYLFIKSLVGKAKQFFFASS